MVKIANIFKAAGVWVGTIFLLYGTQSVDKTVAQAYKGYGALAPTRSPTGQYATGSLTREPTESPQRSPPAFQVRKPSPGFYATGGLGHGGGF